MAERASKWDNGSELASAVTDEGLVAELHHGRQFVWNTITLAWDRMTQPIAGVGGGGGAATIADGADVAQGAQADGAYSGSGSGSVVALLKKIVAQLAGALTVATHAVTQSGTWTVQPGNTVNTVAWKVDGSAVTQPVSLTGVSTAALQTTGNTSISSIDTKTPALVSGRVPVDGSGVTQPVSLVTVPLPAGAATDASLTNGNIRGTVVTTAADGSNVAIGTTTDLSTANTVIGRLKNIAAALAGTLSVSVTNASLAVTGALGRSWTLASGTDSVNVGNFPATQPVSIAATVGVTDASAEASLLVVAKDATLGVAASDSPGAYTVLDQLSRLRKAEEASSKTLAALLAAATPAPPRKTTSTLLHRS